MVTDPYLWLEDVCSHESMNFVREQNSKVESLLAGDPDFQRLVDSLKGVLSAPDRIPQIMLVNSVVYNFWQDENHTRGLLRRAFQSEFNDTIGHPAWETVLDLDLLAAREGRNWVWQDAEYNNHGRCLIYLSDGGSDASVVREFDLQAKSFVPDGFVVPESKANTCWFDADTLLIGVTGGEDEETSSGYPRKIRKWKRGTSLADAPVIFSGQKNDVDVFCQRFEGPEGHWLLILRRFDFFRAEYHLLEPNDSLRALNLPLGSKVRAVFHNKLIISLDEPSTCEGMDYPSGSVLAFPLNNSESPRVIFTPSGRIFFSRLRRLRSGLVLELLDNVATKLQLCSLSESEWKATDLPVPEFTSGYIVASDVFADDFYFCSENFIIPPSLLYFSPSYKEKIQPQQYYSNVIKTLTSQFDASGLIARQYEAASCDGTRVPYFIVHAQELPLNAEHPTLLLGYGGFQVSNVPYYDGLAGKAWLEQGGVYVLANIRGGGEFGPAWHAAALKENRQRAFDDFIAVAEDLINRKISSPNRLAIRGGSNGGLLVGAVMVQRPELFKAVICDAPLLDMFRYHYLLAGASWQAEYGSVENDDAAAHAIRSYSPYQNVKANIRMPTVLFTTSTKDDRVHPAHARKMTAHMQEQGHQVYLYENVEGGHVGAANIQQTSFMEALRYSFLMKTLMSEPEISGR
ncbi:MAG: putative prolyl oligopeptidase family protein PpcE [Pseudomonadota bacterium]